MKLNSIPRSWLVVLLLLVAHRNILAHDSSLGTFTFQGRLNDARGPANGLFDFQFSLYPSSFGTNNQVDTTITRQSLMVTNGLFAVPLSFPMMNTSFDGNDRWLEIAVKPGGVATNYVVLSPRQQLTAVPYAVRANTASYASSATSLVGGIPAGQLTGT